MTQYSSQNGPYNQYPNDMDHYGNGRNVVKYDNEPIHVKLGRVSHNSFMFLFKATLAFVTVLIVLLGIAYVIISRGPVSVSFMVAPMEQAIQKSLGNVTVKIDDTVIQRDEDGFGIVFRIKGLRLINNKGATIAQAPSAAIGISSWGLLFGQIAPSSVHFIGPEIVLVRSKDGQIGLAFGAQGASSQLSDGSSSSSLPLTNGTNTFGNRIGKSYEQVKARQTDVVQTVYNLIKNARDGSAATSYLTKFGVRNAAFLISSEDGETQFNLPRIEVNFNHGNNASVIEGRARLSKAKRGWDLSFRTELNPNAQEISLLVKADQLSPSSLANILPDLKSLDAFRIPLNGKIRFDLTRGGEIIEAESNLTLGKGVLHFSADEKRDLNIDRGNLRFRYNRNKAHIQVLKSSLHWGGSHAVFSGGIQHGQDRNGVKYWQYLLQTQDAAIETKEFGISKRKIDNWSARGFIVPSQKRINLEQLLIQSGESFLDFSGDIIDAQDSPEIILTGKVSPMDISLFKQLWPRLAAPGARDWIGQRVTKGYVTGGTVKVSIRAGMLHKLSKGAGDIDQNSFTFNLGIRDLETYYVTDLPPVQAKEAIAQFNGRTFSIKIPKARVPLPSGNFLEVTEGRFDIPDLREDVQTGIIAFKTGGDAQRLLEFLDLPSLSYLKQADVDRKTIQGVTQGKLKLALPLIKDVKFADMKMQGEVELKKANFPGVAKGKEIGNGTILFNVTEQAVNAKGRVYVNGVPVQLDWHRIFNAPDDKQPGIRMGLKLSSEKLERLGIPVGHFIKGNVPASVTLKEVPGGGEHFKVLADMNDAELILGRLGWRKPPGKSAALEMDVYPQKNGKVEISNFKILGDDITINGKMTLGADGKLEAFSFPAFSVNVVTQLALKGTRHPQRGWKIDVKGPTYDGRQFFKSIFSTGKVSKEQESSKDTTDVEVSVAINTVLGFSNTKMRNVKVFIQQREGRLSVLEAKGELEKGKLLAKLKYREDEARILRAETNNSGYAFKMIGFYPNIVGGETALQVNLDAGNGTKQSGTLWTRNFSILGDEVVDELISSRSEDGGGIVGSERALRRGQVARERLVFDQMKVKFHTGQGLFELEESYLKGPALGLFLKGVIDFEKRTLNLAGQYIPLYDISKIIPGGLLGITFGVRGKLDNPQLLVNPASIVGIGIFRGLFEFDTPSGRRSKPSKEDNIFPDSN